MKFPSLKQKTIRLLSEQSDEEKMYLLKLAAHQILGQKWEYFRKIKNAGKSGGLFKEKSLFEEMKATQSALKFTSKNTLRQYNLAYLNCLKEIKNFAITDEVFPELPDESAREAVKAMIPKQDAVIISWAPIKFLLPARQIREKGTASQRHTEGLIAKLFFKVAGYFAVPENWDGRKLSFYLDRVSKDSEYQDVAQKLEPLKKDLFTFSEEFEPFKFGQATLTKDITSDSDAFDDAMEVESFESQVKTLYWHCFIYRSIESFLFRYYLTIISSTASLHAVRYLSSIFEPALTHAIDMSILFDGSFDTEISRKQFRKPFADHRQERTEEQLTRKIKTKQGIFEFYNYNLSLLARFGVPFNVRKDSNKESFWWLFIKRNILGINRGDLEQELTFTPYHKIGRTVTDTQQQNENLAGEVVKRTEDLEDLKAGMESLKQETDSLDMKFKEEKPEELKKQLLERKNKVVKEMQEAENQIKTLREEEGGVIKQEQQLAQERDKLLEEEEQLKIKETELVKTIEEIETELKKANDKMADLGSDQKSGQKMEDGKAEGNNADPDTDKGDHQKQEVLKADMEQKNEKLTEASEKFKTVTENLGEIADKRSNDIAKGFETTQVRHTEILEEIETLDLTLLGLRKQVKQVQEEEVALEERDVRYKESRKKLVSALKNAEKNEAKDTKTLADTKAKIEKNKNDIIELQEKQQTVLAETKQKLEDLNSLESRSLVLIHILSLLIVSSRKHKEAWQKVLERFKQRLIADQELAKTRVEEIKKESQKKQREMVKKASKLKRLKQNAAAEDFEKEIEQYLKGVDQKCRRILKNAKEEAIFQKERITEMFHRISNEKKKNDALPARQFFDLVQQVDTDESFKKGFMIVLIQVIAEKYDKNLEPLYNSMFGIFRPTLLNKVSLIQALGKSGGDDSVRLKLSDDEQKGFDGIVQGIKNQLRKQASDIFERQVSIQGANATIETLLIIRIDNLSLTPVLSLKFSSPKNPRGDKLNPALVNKIVHLNQIMNPVPENNLLLEGKENEKDPLNRLNTSMLKKLISESAQVQS